MNLDARTALDAQRQRDLDRRDDQNHWRRAGQSPEKLIVTPPWEFRPVAKPPEPQPYTGRWAACPRCGASPPSAPLLAFFPGMIEERPGEERDLYIHQCEEEMI